MERIDYTSLQRSYGGKFVARLNNRVLASGDTHDELVRDLEARNLDTEDIIFEYVRPPGRASAY